MAEKIEIPVSLGLLAATLQIQELRAMLEKSVDIKSTAFRPIDLALSKALNLVNNLKASMSTAFLNTSSAKKFSADLEKMFRLILAIGESFGNLGLNDLIFSPEAKTLIDDLQNQMRSLNAEISRISAGRIGNVFDDSSVENFRQVLDMAALLGVVLSKTTFEDFSSQISNKMAEVRQEIESTKAGIENLKNAANNPAFTKESLLLSLTEKTDLSNIIEKLIDATSAKNLREKIAAAYSNVGLEINEALVANVKSGLGIDSVLRQLTENLVVSATAFETAAKEKKQEISLVIEDLTGLTTSNRYGNSGQTYDRNEKLGLIQDIKTKYANLIDFSKFDELDPNKMGIREYIRHFQEALEQGFKDIDGSTIEKALKENISDAINSALTKDVITDTKSFLNLVLTVLKGIFGDLTFDIQWSSFKGSTVDKAFSDIIQNITNTITSFDPATASEKIQLLELSLLELKSVLEIVNNTATADGSKLQGLLDNYNNLATAVASVVQETLKALGIDVSQIFAKTADSAHGATGAVNSVTDSLAKFESRQKSLSNIQMAVNRWMGFWQVLNMTKSAINDMKQHIQELDTVMTSISVVTNFSLEDLWGQISQYSEIARQYGVAIKGVYEVSLIYYQLGLQLNDVMTLTTETLKMARIAGLDYATAADYMTTAIRGFKLEMTDAAHVTDVFSALAATTASSTEEIATAISKTAASAEAVGASFEATSAMMATMIATTRESATNIGTALKSVISRYGEMTSDPSKMVDSEGEEMSLNRVDKALQTVGITLHDTAGLFRDFDDVMLELMEKWDSLDSLSQRYIATLMAGNRQQSRFLALVSNVDEYKKALETAMNSEGTGELLTLKTLDSIDAKIEKMKVTIQEFYTSSGIEELYKSILDSITNIVSAANSLPKAFGKIPLLAVSIGAALIAAIKSAISLILMEIQIGLEQMKGLTQSSFEGLVSMIGLKGSEAGLLFAIKLEQATSHIGSKLTGIILRNVGSIATLVGSGFTIAGLNTYGASTDEKQDQLAGVLTLIGGGLGVVGSALSGAASGAMMGSKAGPHGMAIGAIIGTITGLVKNFATLKSGLDMYNVSLEREILLSEKRLENAKTNEVKVKLEEKLLEQAYNKLEDLQKHLYDSVEAMQEYHEYMNLLADSYPQYIESIEANGLIIIDTALLENDLAAAREASAAATLGALRAEENNIEKLKKLYGQLLTGLNGVGKSLTNNTLTAMALHETYKNHGLYDYASTPTAYIAETFLLNLIDSTDSESLKLAYSSELQRLYSATSKYTPNNKTAEQKAQEYLQLQGYYGLMNTWASEEMKTSTVARRLYKNVLNEAIKNSGNTLTLLELTGYDIESVDELTVEQFLDALEHTKNIANNYLQLSGLTLDSIEKSIHREAIDEKITRQVNELKRSQEASDLTLSSTIETYSELYGFMLDAHFKDISPENISSEAWDEAFTEVSKWITENTDAAEALMHIDYSSYASFDDLKSDIKNIDQLDKSFITGFKESWERDRLKITTLYLQLLTNIFGSNIPDILLIFDENGNDLGKFNTRTITSILSHLAEYSDLIEKLLYAEAEAYSNNMLSIYEAILNPDNKLTKDEQTLAFDIIKDLDLSDSEALYNISDVFVNMGGNFNNIASIFTTAASRWAINAATLLESLMSSILEIAKSIESSIADMNKVFKYSEALEKAQALMDANEGVKFDELFTFDKDLGGYIKTAKIFSLEISEFLKTSYDAVLQSIIDNLTILPLIDSVNNTIKNLYLTDIKNESITGDRSRYAKLLFKQRLKAVLPEASDADLDRLWSEYTTMIDAFEAQSEDEKEDWNTFTQKYLQERGSDLVKQLEEILQMPQQMAQEALLSFDYTSIISGKGTAQSKETFKALLTQATNGRLSEQASKDLFDLLLKGEIARFNSMMHNLGLDDLQVDKGLANRARFEAFYDAYQKIAGDNSPLWSALDKETLDFLTKTAHITEADYTADPAAAALNLWAVIIEFIKNGTATFNEVAESIAALSNQVYGDTSRERSYQLLNKYKDGLTADELQALLGENDNLLINASTGQLSEKAAEYLTYDNGKFIAKAGLDAASVLAFLALILGYLIDTTTLEYKDTILEEVNNEITRLNNADIDKLRATLISALGNAKVGDRLNVSLLSSATQKHLTEAGLDITNGILTVTSEEALNNGILALKDKLTQGHWAERHPAEAREMESIVSTLESRMNKMTGLSDIISESVTKDAAEAFALAFEGTSEKAPEIMERMGAVWDNLSLTWIIDEDDLGEIESYIQDLEALDTTGANATAISLMRALVENLRDSFARRPAQALNDILTNYTNVSNDMIATFDQYWLDKVDISEYIISIDEVTGNKKIDIVGLKQALIEAGEEVEELFNEAIAQVTDELLNLLSTGVNFLISGTNNFTEMLNFVDNINEKLESNFTIDDLFSYNTALDSFTLDTTAFNNYKKALEKELLDLHWSLDLIDEYIKDLTDVAIQQSIELDSFLNADTKKSRNDEATKLISLIELLDNYDTIKFRAAALASAEIHGIVAHNFEELLEKYNLGILEVLESGGENAVELLKMIKPDASSDELEAAFNSQINKLNDVMGQVGDLVAGSFVGTEGKLYEILKRAGAIDPEADGVVAKGFSMVEVYAAIYAEMSKTAGATTAGLNDAYAKLLTAQDQTNIDITEALQNGNGMSYADFGNLLAKYDISFEKYMTEHYDAVMRDGFGNIRITDWNAFAESIWKDNLDLVKNTLEYTSAFKAYNDGLIELNQNAEDAIVEEIQSISGAKGGDWLNMTTLWSELLGIVDAAVSNIAPKDYKGNVDLANRPIVFADKMKEVFAEFEDDYATLYSESFMSLDFGDFSKNAGMLFTTISASGEVVEDLYSYVKALYDEAAGDTDRMHELDKVSNGGKGLMLFGELFSSYEKLDQYAQDLHDRGAAKDTIGYYLQVLKQYDATLENGILKLGDNANMFGVASTIRDLIDASGIEITNGLAEIQDAIQEVLNSYAGAITKGILGGLTNAEVDDLNAKAKDLGIDNLLFSQDAEGFKLLNDSAKELYNTMKKVDDMQANIIFEELKESLIESDDHFKSIQDTTAYIKQIREAMKSPDNSERIAELQDELELAEKINLVRSGTEDDSFKFMENDIPSGLNNPLNYWKNWAEAFDAMKEAGTASGEARNTMAYEDFYNIVTEMGNLAEISGKAVHLGENTLNNSQEAADLITRAAGALKNVDGELVVDLSSINVDFTSGLKDLGTEIDGQVDALADTLIHMLDSVIAVLEVIVAMEDLKNLDVDDDLTLTLPEMGFEEDTDGKLKLTDTRLLKTVDNLLNIKATMDDGTSILDAVTLSTGEMEVSMREFLENYNNTEWLFEHGIDANLFETFFSNMLKLVSSDDYDDLMNTIQGFLDLWTNLDWGLWSLKVNSGEHTLNLTDDGIYSIDWQYANYDDLKKQVDEYENMSNEEIRKAIEDALKKDLKELGTLTLETRKNIKILNRNIILKKDKEGNATNEWYASGHPSQVYDSPEKAAVAEDLYAVGAENVAIELEGEEITATGTVSIGKFQLDVESDGTLVEYKGPDGYYTERNDAIEAYYREARDIEEEDTVNLDSADFKAWQVEVGISVETIYSINKENSDINNDEKLRDAVRNYLSGKTNATNLEWTEHAVTVELEQGVKITIPTDGVELDKNNANEVNEFVNKSLSKDLNIDLLLADTITKGITNALPSLTDALSKLDAGPAQKVANAIQQIGDNAQTAITKIASLAQELKGLPLLKESNGSKNSGTGAGAHEPEAITGEVSIEGTEKAELDINLFSDTISSFDATVLSATGSVSSTASNMASKYSQAMSEMDLKTLDAAGSTRTHLEEMLTAALTTIGLIVTLIASLPTHVSITTEFKTKTEDSDYITTGGYAGETGEIEQTVHYTTEGEEKIEEVKKEASQEVTTPVNADTDAATLFVNNLIALIETARTVPVNVEVISDSILSYLAGKTYTANATVTASGGEGSHLATGNIGLAKAKGTLMGELGPELVVSNGRYFVAGLNGAEMVNLADDAIVFNHLQTEQLLKHGMSSGRGKAVTSEKNAVAFATGNTGPAMASASAALNALKTLRAMWESLRSASISDLAGAAGGGGGGGGDKAVDPSIWIDTVERWYNLMQKIAKLEKEITHEETLRSKLESDWNANGNHYYASLKRSLEALRDLIDAQEQLNLSRLAYYDLRVEALEKSPFGKLIRFDDEGQMFFQDENDAMEWLTKLIGFDSEGKANYTDEDKYNILMKAGYGDYMKYDSDGGEIKKDNDGDGEVTDDELQTFYGNATKAFWDRINDYKEATLSLWDSIKDGEDSLLDLQADLNSLLEEIRDNQMEVEDEVLKAIEDLRQREIDALQDERDKLEESTLKYIDGLTDALNREQEMYLNLEDETSLNQQRRRLAILQRSGGSAEDIASLRSEIDSSERERYFNLQQLQIDAILAASDLEIERMDSLIEIMTETLEYQKEYGLLWGNVYAVMQESADKIVSFITHGNSEFWTSSALASKTAINEQLFAALQWTSYRDDLAAAKDSIGDNGITAKDISENVLLMATMTREQMKDNDYSIFDEAMKKEFGNDYDKNGTYKDIFYSEYQEHGDLTKVTASARKKYSDDKKAAEATKKTVETTKPSTTTTTTSSSDSSGDSGSSSDNHKLKRAPYWVSDGSSGCHQVAEYTDGTIKGATLPHNLVNGKCSRCGWTAPSVAEFITGSNDSKTVLAAGKGPLNTTPGSAAPWINQVKINTPKVELPAPNEVLTMSLSKKLSMGHKASGGYVNHGVYELGELGTETVLTASQTKVLRDNILSNRPNSLISLLRSYNENYDGINSSLTGITPVEDNSVTIERVEMTMEVKQIANDYDAKRAGEQALNEMMRIARKTGATNSIRR